MDRMPDNPSNFIMEGQGGPPRQWSIHGWRAGQPPGAREADHQGRVQ